MTKKNINLEKSIADLEKLVEELESGDLPLEKAMQKFEQGIKLTRECQAALQEAEQKVEVLAQSAGGEESLQFAPIHQCRLTIETDPKRFNIGYVAHPPTQAPDRIGV